MDAGGHVITHVARAADSYRRLLTGAVEGIETPQYPSMRFRADQIEEGARRTAAELVADVTDSSARRLAQRTYARDRPVERGHGDGAARVVLDLRATPR